VQPVQSALLRALTGRQKEGKDQASGAHKKTSSQGIGGEKYFATRFPTK
jgi:hypothetical protein